MKIVVTGGTGFIGERLVRALGKRGDEVVILSRKAGKSEHANARLAVWTPEKPGPWQDEIQQADAIVHLAGANILGKRWTDEHLRASRASRVVPTKLIAEAIAAAYDAGHAKPEAPYPKTFVCASAVGYYGFLEDDRVCDEAAPPGNDVLANLVKDWEAACSAAEACAGVRVVRARIGVVLGPEGGALEQMLPIFRMGLGGPLGTGKQILPWVHADDTVKALVYALDTPSLTGPVNVTSPIPITMNAFAKALGDVLHRPSFLRVPSFALRLMVGGGAEVVLTGQNAIPKKLVEMGFSFDYADIHEALREAVART